MISISGNSMSYWPEYGVESNDSLLTVNCCGYQKLLTRDLTRSREQGRLDYQIIYIVSGKGYFRFNDETIEVSAGHIVIYPPGVSQYYSYYAKDITEAYWIHFTGYAVHEYLTKFGLLHPLIHSVGVMDEVISLFKKITNELNMNMPLSDTMTTAHFLSLLTLLGRKLQNAAGRQKIELNTDINKAIEIMHERYNQELTIAELAQICNLSTFRFIHKFKAVTGMTPMKYVTGIRIDEAKKLLSETSLNVKEVASIVGYENPLYFSRVFSKEAGMPPSQYKNQFF